MPGVSGISGLSVSPFGSNYAFKIAGMGPITHWILGEGAGTVAVDEINSPAQDGVYARGIGIMGTGVGIGDGNTAARFHGAADDVDIHTATFEAAFNTAEGTVIVWARLADAGVWTDGQSRRILSIRTDGGNQIQITKDSVVNQLVVQYVAGAVSELWNPTLAALGNNPDDWFQVALTWSVSGDVARVFCNGAQFGADATVLGAWAGALANATIGSLGSASNWFDGYISHVMIFDRALTPSEISYTYSIAPWVLEQTYHRKVLSYSPIAYWPQWEGAGLVAYDQINSPAQDGTYVGPPTLGQLGIGDGNNCPLYDGTNDNVIVTSAALLAAFDIAQGSALFWARMVNLAAWTDGLVHNVCMFRNGGYTDIVTMRKGIADNSLTWQYRAGGVDKGVVLAGLTTTDWICMLLTWDVNAGATGEMIAYYNGIQTGLTQTNLGVPAAITSGFIGSDSAAQRWAGWLQHSALFGHALSPAAVADLYVVP